jgi:pimeloyl-ACP methyl ester carboxylesterase
MSERDVPTIPNPLGGERRYWRWRDYDIAYVRRGDGPPIVFVHSVHAAAWSMEWRNVVPALSEKFTTFSLDLLGFGASAHPAIHYTANLYVDLLHDFLTDVVLKPASLIGSSLGGTYAIAVASQHPELVTHVCAIGPAGITRLRHPGGTASGLVEKMLRSPNVGAALFSALTSKSSMRRFLKDIYRDKSVLTEDVLDLYWRAAHQPNARFAPSAFVGMKLNLDVRADLRAMRCPFMLVWGEHAAQTPLKESEPIRALRPDSPFVILPGADLPHEESPKAFVDAVVPFLDS